MMKLVYQTMSSIKDKMSTLMMTMSRLPMLEQPKSMVKVISKKIMNSDYLKGEIFEQYFKN